MSVSLCVTAIATAAATEGCLTEFTPAILSGGYFVVSRSAGGNVEHLEWHVNLLTRH